MIKVNSKLKFKVYHLAQNKKKKENDQMIKNKISKRNK